MTNTGLERFWKRRRSMAFDEFCTAGLPTPAAAA
jgi:hypothetical protein